MHNPVIGLIRPSRFANTHTLTTAVSTLPPQKKTKPHNLTLRRILTLRAIVLLRYSLLQSPLFAVVSLLVVVVVVVVRHVAGRVGISFQW